MRPAPSIAMWKFRRSRELTNEPASTGPAPARNPPKREEPKRSIEDGDLGWGDEGIDDPPGQA